MKRTKYAVVGTGGRVVMFIDPIVSRFKESCELVGLCDTSEVRRTYHQQRLVREYGASLVPTYGDFDKMLLEQKPDVVVVCTPDNTHHDFIIRSLNFGADVVSEKPLTTDGEKCEAILEAVKLTGRRVRTTFNLRWAPGLSKVKELIEDGVIGRVKHVDFEYMLNTSHGADYFRRWHSNKAYSGGLLVHKSTHHFDIVNWWLDAIPETVFAFGSLAFYGKENAIKRGDLSWTTGDRYSDRSSALDDPFHLNLDGDPLLKSLYRAAENETGYIRDKNVFRSHIDIEDSMSVLVRYRTGETLTYSLNAFCPQEGFRVSLSGDRGRMEFIQKFSSHVLDNGGKERAADERESSSNLVVQKHFSDAYEVPILEAEGSHGGADPLLQEQIFSPSPSLDVLSRNAGCEQGAASLLIGAAANQSIELCQPVRITDICRLKPEAVRLRELV